MRFDPAGAFLAVCMWYWIYTILKWKRSIDAGSRGQELGYLRSPESEGEVETVGGEDSERTGEAQAAPREETE